MKLWSKVGLFQGPEPLRDWGFGISKLLKFVEYHIHMTMTRICHFISVTTYVCIPTIYLKMDRKFVKSFLPKRTSDVNDKGFNKSSSSN